ncbi:hypothetical protein E2C01_020296 [Portunus trituberculatus]|uniref:Uncharacterized protein n=1 Tax=Portunus trituberculatus TaxID=210409 RepID=A0A5B7E2S7_PORTR|nr:hypothetical protein [Portunus trituberculatus]
MSVNTCDRRGVLASRDCHTSIVSVSVNLNQSGGGGGDGGLAPVMLDPWWSRRLGVLHCAGSGKLRPAPHCHFLSAGDLSRPRVCTAKQHTTITTAILH